MERKKMGVNYGKKKLSFSLFGRDGRRYILITSFFPLCHIDLI
jgi:hypothetical protein